MNANNDTEIVNDQKIKSSSKLKFITMILPLAVFLLSIIFYMVSGFSSLTYLLFVPIMLGASLNTIIYYRVQVRNKNEQTRERIAYAEERVEKQPEKAKYAWDLARITLEAYFTRNLSQINYIFWFSVTVLLAGFVIIIWGIYQVVQSPNMMLPAVISSTAGVITEFIGATFLFIYKSTIQQAANYSKTLERINSVGMAMQILDIIPDDSKQNDLKSNTKAKLIELLIRQTHEYSGQQHTDEFQ